MELMLLGGAGWKRYHISSLATAVLGVILPPCRNQAHTLSP